MTAKPRFLSSPRTARSDKKLNWRNPILLLLWAGLAGCGPALYTLHILPAVTAVEQAEEAGAEEHAPYEYYYARENLSQAQEEAGDAFYQDARRHAEIAEEYGLKAREIAARHRREEGR